MILIRIIFISFIIVSCQAKTASIENVDDTNINKPVAFIHGIDTVIGDKLHICIKKIDQTGDTFATGLSGLSKIKNIEIGLRSKKNNYKLNVSEIVIMQNKDSIIFSARLEPLKYNLTIEPLKENNSR